MKKIYIDNSTFMEYIDELATRITEERFGEETWTEGSYEHVQGLGYRKIRTISEEVQSDTMIFNEDAQDFYNDVYDEYETLTNNILGLYCNSELDNLEDIAKKYRELKLNK